MDLTTFQIKNKTIAKGIGWNTEINESVFRPNTLSNFRNQILFRPVYSPLDLGFNVTWDWLLHAVEWLEIYGGFSIKIQDLRVESKTINSAEFYDFVEKSDGFYNKFDITYEADNDSFDDSLMNAEGQIDKLAMQLSNFNPSLRKALSRDFGKSGGTEIAGVSKTGKPKWIS